jgi:hypothetical protein
MSLTAVKTSAPTPPAAPPLAGRGVAGTGLSVVEGEHWSKRLGTYRPAGMSDGWPLAVPFIGAPIGLMLNHVIRSGDLSVLLYAGVGLLTLVILVSLVMGQAVKAAKRQRRLARAR